MAKKKENQAYDNSSITLLKGADRVRKKPAVIFGSDGIEGCQHSVFEILSNSIDEAREGYGNKITLTRYKDGSFSVEDMGRGIPVEYNEREERYNWEIIFCEMYGGGKYSNNEGANYEYSLGLNGLGLCATQYASEYMDAEIYRDGHKFTLHFEKGENIGGFTKEPTARRQTGTKIHWKPDREVFTDIDISLEYVQDMLRRQAIVNPKITMILKNQTKEGFETFEYLYEEGIVDHIKEVVGENAITSIQIFEDETKGKDRDDLPEYKVKMSAAFCFSNRANMLEYYHNSSYLEQGGSPDKAVRSAFVSQIDAYLKQNNRYLKNESKITFQDIEDCLVYISNSFSTLTSYANQTKKAITNKFIATAMTEFLRHKLEIYFIENPEEAKKIADQILINKHSREKAEKTRLDLKKTLATSNDSMVRVEKFVDCRTKDKDRREIYIVEGDSALGSCKQGRDSEFQAIIPVRGKILNCLKAEYDKIFKNEIITDLIKVLGCGVEVKTKSNKDISLFNLDGLRWNKVVICTDADVDGFQIRTLILTMLYRLVPTLIEEGYVYIAESPLFEINTKDKTYFAYTEAEKADILKRIEGQKFTIQRSKGLGENEPEMMWLTTMNPETRRLIKVTPTDAEKTAEVFDLLLGDNLEGRKEFIQTNGGDYLDLADIS